MAELRPSLEECERLVPPLNEGELRVAAKLSELDDSWTIYVQPRLAQDVPDFVAVHDQHGVCAIEVKHWSRGAYRQTGEGAIEHIDANGVPRPISEQPRYQAYRYRSTIFDQFFAFAEDGDGPSQAVRAVVILPDWSNEHAARLLERRQVTDSELTVRVWGGDGLEQSVEAIVCGPGCPTPRAESIARLRRQLVESLMVSENRQPVRLSADARNIASNPSNARRRRVRGPAGCGKSFGLAARAARLAGEGQRVLVLTFNTTLANYLRSLVTARCHDHGANPTRVTCTNFHGFCQRLVEDAERAGFVTCDPPDTTWYDAVVVRARAACEAGFALRYDAVLIDEGQDFTLEWWNLLRHHMVGDDGEMLLVADPTQDVYDVRAWTDEERMIGAGFSGPWTELKGSYRMPSDIVPLANRFAERYLDGERLTAGVPIDHVDISGAAVATKRHWQNIASSKELGRAVGHEVVRLLTSNPDLCPNDVVFLCEHHRDGLDAVAVIEQAGLPLHHIFAVKGAEKARRKRRFWPDAPGVKGCTVHSFKGWETPALVMGIGIDIGSRRLAYVAMTRVRVGGADRPSYLSVLNADLTIAGFQSAFERWAPPTIPIWAPPRADARIG